MYSPEHNLIEAASNGATASIKVLGSIGVNVLAFLSLLAFLNATLTWFGDRIGIEELTFEVRLLTLNERFIFFVQFLGISLIGQKVAALNIKQNTALQMFTF